MTFIGSVERNGVSVFHVTKSNTPEIETWRKGCRWNQTVRSLILYYNVLLCIYVGYYNVCTHLSDCVDSLCLVIFS